MRVYLAGPNVFMSEPVLRGEVYKKYASKLGLVGLYPMDNEVDFSADDPGRIIYEGNKQMLESADVVLANLSDFRGHDPDAGTVWEVAYAVAKGIPVIAYTASEHTLKDRMVLAGQAECIDGVWYDSSGRRIENFGNKVNLMLQYSVDHIVVGTIRDGLDYVKNHILDKKMDSMGLGK